MARPRKKRTVCFHLKSGLFSPESFSNHPVSEVVLEVDEIEAIRLVDLNGQYQTEAAQNMSISRPTLSNIIHSAHQKIAEALIQGKAIRLNCPKLIQKRKKVAQKHKGVL